MDNQPFPPARRRLTKSRRERMWTGVCGGLAEYFDLDPVLVRLFWVVATVLTAGLALVAYFCLAVIMPPDDRDWNSAWGPTPTSETGTPPAEGAPGFGAEAPPSGDTWPHYNYGPYDYHRRRRTAGLVLVALGVLFLASQAGVFRFVQWQLVWPAILIVIGVALLARRDWRA